MITPNPNPTPDDLAVALQGFNGCGRVNLRTNG